MSKEIEESLKIVAQEYLKTNYNMVFLKAMLLKGKHIAEKGTLITGSSHALNGIEPGCIANSVNCSMHSQDIYYDFLCAKDVLENGRANAFTKCFIVMGYYIAYHDLSRSTVTREKIIRPIYYPLFRDVHNWGEESVEFDPWKKFGEVPQEVKSVCELMAMQMVLDRGSYYSDLRTRIPFFNFRGRVWHELSAEEKEDYGTQRAGSHNKQIVYKASFLENCEIMKDYIHMLHMHGVLPVVVITPFTVQYNKNVDPRFKDAIREMLERIPEEVHYVDFNESNFFTDEDFVDTDHLNRQGAIKVSCLLDEMFKA